MRGIPEDTLCLIDGLHDGIEAFIKNAVEKDYPEEYVENVLTHYDYTLQSLWRFPEDKEFHTLFKRYKWIKHWYGRKFRCIKTGTVYQVPFEIYETMFIPIGEGFLDLGRKEGYYRMSGIEEIK